MGKGATQLNREIMVDTGTGVASIFQTPGFWHKRFSYNASGRVQYMGWAKVGVGTATVGWAVAENEYDGSNRVISVIWGSGNANFDKRWTNRGSYTYT